MMNILGIDSSGLVASVALQSDDKLVGEYTIHNKKTHSQTLLPMIHDMLEMADVSVKELDAIAIASGPGSFTGLQLWMQEGSRRIMASMMYQMKCR